MKITWVNHASFILEHGNIRMITDPWLEGTAFDNGWGLISETRLPYEGFKDITHIWFSHEHPDHFSPPCLRKIPEAYRRNITVIFQGTIDQKVYHYCKNNGFKEVIELKKSQWHYLRDDLKVMCNPFTGGDSWICIKSDTLTILNLNDCVITKPRHAEDIKALVGDVDVLLTQFSYAGWAGNKEDEQARIDSAKEKLERVALQLQVFKPTYTIPFASFVWFCHEDNYYMNDHINKIDHVYDFLSNSDTKPVVLYPDEKWIVGNDHDSAGSIQKYQVDYETIENQPELSRSTTIEEKELIDNADKYTYQLKKKNNRLLLSLFKRTKIHVVDLDKTYILSLKSGLIPSTILPDDCDISLKSDALNYSLKHLWGGGTLGINGRFQIPKNGKYWGYMKYGVVSDLNNTGKTFGVEYVYKLIMRKLFHKVE